MSLATLILCAAAFATVATVAGSGTEEMQSVNGRLHCYGDGGFQKDITGDRIPLDHNFTCPECSGQIQIYGGVPGVELSLSSKEIHVFQNGSLLQSLPLSDCSPLSLYQSHVNPERSWVQCESSPPSYNPTYNRIDRSGIDSWTLTGGIEKQGLDILYVSSTTNSIIMGGRLERNLEDFVIAMIRGSPEVVIHSDSSTNPVTYSLASRCDSLVTLHASEPLGEDNHLQFVVDCIRNGRRKRWVITLDGFLEDAMDPYELQHTSGTVSLTSDGNYFVIQDTSQIFLVNRYNPNSEPTVETFPTLITGTKDLTNNFLLVESPGLNRVLINVTEFTSTTAQDGSIVLSGSEAYCPNGVCPATVVVENRYLVVFVKDDSYFVALAYDLDNLQFEPSRVGSLYVGNVPHICFYQEGDTPLFLRPSPPRGSTQTTSPPSTTTESSTSSGLETGAIVGIAFGVIALIVIVILCAVVVYRLTRQHTHSGKSLNYNTTLKSDSKSEFKTKEGKTEHEDEIQVKIIEPPDVISVSDTSSGVHIDTSSAESSRLSTPVPQLSNKQRPDLTLLHAAVTTEQTSDYSTGGESSSAPSLSPSPEPRRHQAEVYGKAVTQQNGDYSSDRTQMVAPKLPSQFQPNNSNGNNSVHPPIPVQEESIDNPQISRLILESRPH